MDSFNGFSLSDVSLVPTRSDGTNLVGNVTLPNPSILTLEIGTIVLDVKSGDLVIGNATIENLTLKPGNHANPMTGILDLGLILRNIGTVLADQGSSIKENGSLSLVSTTRTVTWNGTQVPYYTTVMSELPLTATLPILDTLRNTIKSYLGSSGNRNWTEIIANLKNHTGSESGSSLLADLKDGLSALEDDTNLKPRNWDHELDASKLLGRALKLNPYVREAFQNEPPAERDAMIDSLAGWYVNQH